MGRQIMWTGQCKEGFIHQRPLARLDRVNPRLLLVIAPVGYGKTSLVTEYLRRSAKESIWLTATGQSLASSGLLREASNQRSERGGDPTLVIEGCRLAGLDSSAVSNAVNQLLLEYSQTVILSPEARPPASFTGFRGALVLGKRDLKLNDAETLALLDSIIQDGELRETYQRRAADCDGHAGLLDALVSSLASPATSRSDVPDMSMSIMIEAILSGIEKPEGLRLLELATLMRPCTIRDLELVGESDAMTALREISDYLPLVRIHGGGLGDQCVWISDLLAEHVVYGLRTRETPWEPLPQVLDRLSTKREWGAIRLALECAGTDADAVRFVEAYGARLLHEGQSDCLLQIVSNTTLGAVLSSPTATLQWAQALQDQGLMDEGESKARAAYKIAAYENDWTAMAKATSHAVRNLTERGHSSQAIQLVTNGENDCIERAEPEARAEVLTHYSVALAAYGRTTNALEVLARASEVSGASGKNDLASSSKVDTVRIQLEPLITGDWMKAVRQLGPVLHQVQSTELVKHTMMGNMAFALVETGRIDRAREMLDGLLEKNEYLEAAFLPALAQARAAEGEYSTALGMMERAADLAKESDYLPDYGYALLCEAIILRAAGSLESSLVAAELAFEMFASSDFFGLACRAAVEVAASRLSLGDASAAGQMLDTARSLLNSSNRYHAAAIALVQSVLNRRLGSDGDIECLLEYRDFLHAESVNWLSAMYCRCFPELREILLTVWDPLRPPVHLMRLIGPTQRDNSCFVTDEVENGIALADQARRSDLDQENRCDVRLFGGLGISVGGRTVEEADWAKSKARLLFLMLVVRRGQDIPRDQLLEHLWPDFSEERARNNFYVVWSSLRATLRRASHSGSDTEYVQSRRGRCRVVAAAVYSDLDYFDDLVVRIRSVVDYEEAPRLVELLEDLSSLYRGELLPGDVYDDWFQSVRQDYASRFVDAMAYGSVLLRDWDECAHAERFARRALGIDPLREDIYQVALDCCTRLGKRSSAIQLFSECRSRLAEELGLDPSVETRRLYSEILELG